MNISQTGINLIREFEGCVLGAYRDPIGIWTIGYGHTKGVYQGMRITQQQADDFLRQDIKSHVTGIDKYVKVSLNQNQFDALASFHFNLGAEILRGTGLLNSINAQNWQAAANQINLYVNAGGKPLQGLIRRRKAEANLFLKNGGTIEPSQPGPSQSTSTYTVRSGDALSLIAQAHKTTTANLQNLNGIKDANMIYVGQVIKVPGESSADKVYTVKNTDYSLGLIAQSLGVSLDHVVRKNNINNPNLIYPGQKLKY